MHIHFQESYNTTQNTVFLIEKSQVNTLHQLSATEQNYVSQQFENKQTIVEVNQYNKYVFVVLVPTEKQEFANLEQLRKAGFTVCSKANALKLSNLQLGGPNTNANYLLALAEGIALSNYQFIKYFKNVTEKQNSLTDLYIQSAEKLQQAVHELQAQVNGTYIARTLVNEPLSYLTAEQLGNEVMQLAKQYNFKAEVLNKQKIEALKMGGLLAVNKGSIDPPTFSILEYKPENAKNQQPIVLVGKGVVYDTGGLSLKPTPNSMDEMKSDMAGAATVVGVITAIAQAKLPVHVVGLIPATDNRPGNNAYTPGDIVTTFDGTTVEVLNTDAEGRMILCDALSYAKKYNPELVLDFATLTGAAVRAIGQVASCSMGTATQETFNQLSEAGFQTYERTVQMPFWDEYGDMMKSDIADLKNIGGPMAGQISAGKFLEHFTKNADGTHAYPWIHVDIAGPSYLLSTDSYRGKYGTGTGVRLVFNFLKNNFAN